MKKQHLNWTPLEEATLKHGELYLLVVEKKEGGFYHPFTAYWRKDFKFFDRFEANTFSNECRIDFAKTWICKEIPMPK